MNCRVIGVSAPPDGWPWGSGGGLKPIIPGPKVEGARPVRTRVAGVGGAILPTEELSSVMPPRHGLLSAQLSATAFPQRLNSAAKLGAAVPRILFSTQFGAAPAKESGAQG